MISEFGAKFKAIRREIRDEYTQPHSKPWILGFSGGKDSTLLAHLVLVFLLLCLPLAGEVLRGFGVSQNMSNILKHRPVLSGIETLACAWKSRAVSVAAKKGAILAGEREPAVRLRYGLFGRASGPS